LAATSARVPTYADTLEAQKELRSLCAPRDLITSEIFAANDNYGIASVLKRYCSLPEEAPLRAIVPHGVYLDDTAVHGTELSAMLPVVLSYPEYRNRVYADETDKVVVPSASPFLYLLEMAETTPVADRRGTLFFPAHSTHHISARMDFEGIASTLAGIDDDRAPISVCVYWRDYELGLHKPFVRAGLNVVSAGHIFDKFFLWRLSHLLSSHRFAGSNALGSHLFYASAAGCEVFMLDAPYEMVEPEETVSRDFMPPTLQREEEVRAAFSRTARAAEQKRMAEYYLGAANLKSPEELRAVLAHAKIVDRLGTLLVEPGQRMRAPKPYALRRALRRWKDAALGRMRGLRRRLSRERPKG